MKFTTLAPIALVALAACGGGSDAGDELRAANDQITDLEAQIEELRAGHDEELRAANDQIADLEAEIEELQADDEAPPDTEVPEAEVVTTSATTATAPPTTAPPTTAPPTTAPPTTTPPTTAAPGPNLTPSQRQAVRSAESYLDFTAFSRQGLIDQLSSEYGEKFPVEDATVAVDSLTVDWNEQAAKSAQSYLELTSFSCQGLIEQLSSEFGEKFTMEQARYGATTTGIC